MILDSPFDRLENVITQIAKTSSGLPQFLIKGGLFVVDATIREQCGFSISKVNPIEHAEKVKVPALFMIGSQDSVLEMDSFMKLFRKYGGPKQMTIISGAEHCDCRSEDPIAMHEALSFVSKQLSPATLDFSLSNPYNRKQLPTPV